SPAVATNSLSGSRRGARRHAVRRVIASRTGESMLPSHITNGKVNRMTQPLLVDVAWLAQHLERPAVRIFDATVQLVRPPEGGPYEVVSGRPEYEAGHIPGAVFADVAHELADPDSPFHFAVPSPERFA